MTQPAAQGISTHKRGWFPRRRIDELMDAPSLPEHQHRQALAGLRRINSASNVVPTLAREIIAWARHANRTQLRMLDVACGGGDVPIGVAQAAKSAGILVDLTLVDRSETALQQAAANATAVGFSVRIAVADATRALPNDAVDVVTNSLFLHHLDEADVIAALANMKRSAQLLLVSDLRRSMAGYAFAWAGCRVLSRSPIVHFDGPVSVRAAWTIDEMHRMADAAGLDGARVTRQWPFRMTVRWERHD